jgi:predicted Zn-dependent protease
MRLPRAVRLAGGLIVAASLTTGCATGTPGPVAGSVPAITVDAEIAALGRVPVYEDLRLATYLAGIVDRLAAPEEREVAVPAIDVVVVRDPTIGILAMPGPRIYVHTGLLAALESEAQLAAVLAREVSHLREGQTTALPADTQARIAVALDAIAPSIAAAMARGDDSAMLSPMAAAILGGRLPHAFIGAIAGRGDAMERTADTGAVERLVRAGYEVAEFRRAFERLRRAAAEGGAAERFFIAGDESTTGRLTAFAPRPDEAAAGAAGDRADFDGVLGPLVRENAGLELRAGRFRAARVQLDRVLASDPEDARAHLYDGDLHRLRAQRARSVADRDELARAALASYQRCEALDPSVAEVSRQIGLLYYQQGRQEQARVAFERYLTRWPDAPDAARVAEYVLALTR